MSKEKRDTLERIRKMLDDWEAMVDGIGNECAYTDRIIDGLTEAAFQLRKIS